MTIPKSIAREHVLLALSDIDRKGVPEGRESTRYELVHEGRRYPPKVVLSLATFHATGNELDCSLFSGGRESNDFLARLGFTCVRIQGGAVASSPPTKDKQQPIGSNAAETAKHAIGRIIVDGPWQVTRKSPGAVLDAVIKAWPSGMRVRYLMTCGGFLGYAWDAAAFPADPREANEDDLTNLIEQAQADLDALLTTERRSKLATVADVLTVGIDGFSEVSAAHIELVAIVTLATNEVTWTGKSYPIPAQERDLVTITGLQTHCFQYADDRVLVLGCHDLNLFSPRSRANAKGWRTERIDDTRDMAKSFQPTVVLQHPHTADTPNLWRTGWDGLRKDLPTVAHLAGSGRYENGENPCRGTLDKVLMSTRQGNVLDIVVRSKPPYRAEFRA